MDASTDLAQSFDQAARTLNQHRSLDETLQTIVEVACNSVPGFDQVGISTVQKHGKIVTRAFTGDLVPHLDDIQYSLREGPCSAALQGTDTVCVSSLHIEDRWPRYVPEARDAGIRSQMAVKLYLDGDTLGGINFYSTESDEVTHEAQALARLFATHAAIALGHAHERENLTQAVQSRQVIGQATGIVMERYQIPEDHAFAFLVRVSSHSNIKMREVAQQLVDESNAKRPTR
jgi:GAF domain-containing protein